MRTRVFADVLLSGMGHFPIYEVWYNIMLRVSERYWFNHLKCNKTS
jgi:hypothetical protein